MYLPNAARFSNLLDLPEGVDIGGAMNAAMKAIEDENEELKAGSADCLTHLTKTVANQGGQDIDRMRENQILS